MSHRVGGISAWLLGSLLLVGCMGTNDPNRQHTEPVTVKVNYKDKPVEGATVTFTSMGDKPLSAVGRTNAQGVANLRTYEHGDGAVVGSHRVTIAKSEIINAPPEAADVESEDYQPPGPGGTPAPVLKDLIPRKYSVPGTSGLTAEVIKGSPLEVTFDLTD